MNRTAALRAGLSGSFLAGSCGCLVLVLTVLGGTVLGEDPQPADYIEPLFNWDLISLEQNNPRFNASVLTGFHSVRSPGVTPYRGWKLGVGANYTREEQVSNATQISLFDRDQVLLSPKLNYGFFPSFEAGAALTGSFAQGRELVELEDGTSTDEHEDNLGLNSVDLGLKWKFWDEGRFRTALSFDTRIALARGEFGNIPGTFFNVEIDADFAITGRFSTIANLQFLTSDSATIESQFMGDIGAVYSFSDQFRGMLFGTLQEDDEAGTVLGFVGIAGQYVFEQHSFTAAFDLQLNDAGREDVRTQEQFDVELSYTFTF